MERPVPYRGDAPYIFISYSHKDSDRVWPIVARMLEDGYRVWYDDGIDPGVCWDDVIAERVENCGCFIAFLSRNYLASEICKDELLYGRDFEKPQLLVYLEDVRLPGGLAMRLNRIQAVLWHQYAERDRAFAKLYEAKGIREFCNEEEPAVKAILSERIAERSSPADFDIRDGLLVSYRGKSSKVIVPEGVTAIGEEAFADREHLLLVDLPQGVETIGKRAFSHCKGLLKVVLPDTLKDIGDYAFAYCDHLEYIRLPSEVSRLGVGVFYQNVGLTRVEVALDVAPAVIDRLVEDGLPMHWVLSDRAALQCQAGVVVGYEGSEEVLALPEGVSHIGYRVFAKHNELKWVELPESLHSVGREAFLDCSGLKCLRLGGNLTYIRERAFAGCTSLVLVDLPENIRMVAGDAFTKLTLTASEQVPAGTLAAVREQGVMVRREDVGPEQLRVRRLKRGLCPDCESKLGLKKKCARCK